MEISEPRWNNSEKIYNGGVTNQNVLIPNKLLVKLMVLFSIWVSQCAIVFQISHCEFIIKTRRCVVAFQQTCMFDMYVHVSNN